jgi:fermentation-respiration switch protein FrsA (DUF1100 family)
MEDAELSSHTRDMLVERALQEAWIWRAIKEPDQIWTGDDGNEHYAKAIAERENKMLHVVVNPSVQPRRVVTVFFDRRLGS